MMIFKLLIPAGQVPPSYPEMFERKGKAYDQFAKEIQLMKAEYLKDGNKLTVCTEGRIDTLTAPELERSTESWLENISDLVLDLEKTDYISSAGLRLMLAYLEMMEACGGSFRVIHASDPIKEVFSMTGLLDLIDVR